MRSFSLFSVVTLLILCPGLTIAKPSLRRATKDVGFKDVIRCKFKSRGKFTQKGLTLYYTRQMECIRKGGVKGYPKIKKLTDGYVEYIKSGRRYTYSSWFHWGTRYLGLPAPKKKLVVKLVKKNWLSFLGRAYDLSYIVSKLSKVRVAPKPAWVWYSPTKLTVSVIGNYRRKRGGWRILDIQHLKRVTLERKTIKSPWKYVSTSKSRKSSDEKVLKTIKLPPSEYKKIKSLGYIAENKKALAYLDSLPKVKVPTFKTAKELRLYTYKMLRTVKSPKHLEAYLRKVYSPYFFTSSNKNIMNENGKKFMNYAISNALKHKSKFKDQYCKQPIKKSKNKFYNKTQTAYTRMGTVYGKVKYINGKAAYTDYKLNTLRVSVLKGEGLARMKSFKKDFCPRPLTAAEKNLRVPKVNGKGFWKIGDKVSCAYKGRRRYYSGVIKKIKGKKLFIRYNDGDKEWTTAKYLKEKK
ncbi:MAG: hypothetical protein PF689_12830 [Deltaproteobacteria bacterium]|nr:hypothetical protein [Deltaproteobacteria bacterium]